MLLQSCVATTTLQKGGGKQNGAEFSKVFQGFCLRLSEVAGKFRSMRKKCQIRLQHFQWRLRACLASATSVVVMMYTFVEVR